MTERMSEEQYRTRVLWLSCNVELDDGQAKSIADDWQRARAEEERLNRELIAARRKIAGLEEEIAATTKDDDRIRRIVREEMRKAQLDVTAKHGYSALGSMRIVEQPFACAMWPDEEANNG